jgi:hypothetical protein
MWVIRIWDARIRGPAECCDSALPDTFGDCSLHEPGHNQIVGCFPVMKLIRFGKLDGAGTLI